MFTDIQHNFPAASVCQIFIEEETDFSAVCGAEGDRASGPVWKGREKATGLRLSCIAFVRFVRDQWEQWIFRDAVNEGKTEGDVPAAGKVVLQKVNTALGERLDGQV